MLPKKRLGAHRYRIVSLEAKCKDDRYTLNAIRSLIDRDLFSSGGKGIINQSD